LELLQGAAVPDVFVRCMAAADRDELRTASAKTSVGRLVASESEAVVARAKRDSEVVSRPYTNVTDDVAPDVHDRDEPR
jgi:hypothetical protein